MTNKNFEHIDKLFREGLNPEEEQLTFPEADWSKLKERLDRNERKKRGVFWLSRMSGVAALILLLFAIRMLLPEDQKEIIQQVEVQQKDQKVNEDQNKKTASSEDKKNVIKTEKTSTTLVAQNKHLEGKSPQKQIDVQSAIKETPKNDTAKTEILIVPNLATGQTANLDKLNTTQPESVKSPVREQSSTEESLFAANEKPNEKPEPENQLHKLALSVFAAPGYNGVNNLNNAVMGSDFGLIITLGIAKKLSLSTGAIYGKKLYETGFNNYNPIKDIWTEYYPTSVNADCRVLDIPLNINYTFINRKNTSFSLGSGISSYIMLREDYSFSYVEQDHDTALEYHVVNENTHWLSVLNLQATLEQRITSKVSIGLQPYMKIPLSNIGFAGVKLQSVGMAVILSWNLN
jgi:hypothetical protein